jgi:HD superfamily phosphohydrolase YqeK
MTLMDKIVYLADFFEPNRPVCNATKKAKSLAYDDIDRAMAFVLGFTIEKNLREGKAVYYKSLEAREFYETKP